MYPEIKRSNVFHYTQQEVFFAIIHMCREKKEYECLEEASKNHVHLYVHKPQKQNAYYLLINLFPQSEKEVLVELRTKESWQPADAVMYLEVNTIMKEFLFILKNYLHIIHPNKD